MGSNQFSPLILLVTVLYLSSTIWVPVEGNNTGSNSGSDLLDQAEANVTFLKNKVEENYGQRCELVASCRPDNCSRNSCSPLVGDIAHLTCQEVKNNPYCGIASFGTCRYKYFDYTRSYVRLAPTTVITADDTVVTICSQRELDAAFKSMCTNTSHSRTFLGNADGTYIHFPGSEQSKDDCGKYDPRLRPWYRASTSVMKAVMVLVDGGALGNPLPPPLTGTFLNLTRDIVTDLLNTLSEKDVVNIIIYDSSKATPLASSPVPVVYNITADSTFHPEFADLKVNLSNAVSSGGSSDIAFGISAALANYAGFDLHMKIIIVFTAGNSINFQKKGSLSALKGEKVKVFVFKLPQKDDVATPTESFFLTELQSIGGSYNVITSSPSEVNNRLLSILPYFSFLANFRASLNDSADYSLVYEDYEHVVGNIFSITKPAFAGDGKLLGIVGLNIFVDELRPPELAQSVINSLPGRGGKAFNSSNFVLTAANASIQNVTNPTKCNDGSSIPTPSNPVLCAQNDNISTIQDFTCCGERCSSISPDVDHKLIYIGIGVGVPAFIVVILLIAYVVRRCWLQHQREFDKRELHQVNSSPFRE